MAINVNTNVSAMTAQRYLNHAAEGQQKSMERLSRVIKSIARKMMLQVYRFQTV